MVPMAMMPVTVMAPADFLRLEVIDFSLRDNRGFRAFPVRKHKGLLC